MEILMSKPSKITEIISTRLAQLKSLKEETSPVGHGSSIGLVREHRLTTILRDYLPRDIGIETGFLCDTIGSISPQLDIIVCDNDPIPLLDFDDLFKIVPVEKALVAIEVKSTLQEQDLYQLKRQVESIRAMPRCIGLTKANESLRMDVMVALYAIDCAVSESKVQELISSDHNIRQVTVIDRFSMRNGSWGGFDIQRCERDGNFIETRKSFAWLLNMISDQQENRKMYYTKENRRLTWGAYLGVEKLSPTI